MSQAENQNKKQQDGAETDFRALVYKHPMASELASGLEELIAKQNSEAYSKLSTGQKIFLKNWLFAASAYAADLSEENRRLHGNLPMRTLPKASSFVFTGQAEKDFYSTLLEGKLSPEVAKKLFAPQDIVYTTHPNFSQNPELAKISPEIVKIFAGLDADDLAQIGMGGERARQALERVAGETGLSQLLEQAVHNLKPRTARSRGDELDEASVALVPRLYSGIVDEVAIMLKRAKQVMVKHPALDDHSWQKVEDKLISSVPGKDGKPVETREISFEKHALDTSPLSLEQVQALAALTSNHSTWFTDGDGKRTSHAWDNEYALPGIKAAALGEFKQSLRAIKEEIGHKSGLAGDVDEVLAQVDDALNRVSKLRDAARKRMLALTELQGYSDSKGPTPRDEVDDHWIDLRRKAREAGSEYRQLRNEEGNRKALTTDYAAMVGKLAAKLKRAEEKEEINVSRVGSSFDAQTPLSLIDALIIKTSKGDFPTKIERRENANQHKEAMRYFLENVDNSEELISQIIGRTIPGSKPPQKLSEQEFRSALRATAPADERNLSKVLKVIDEIVSRSVEGRADEAEKAISEQLAKVMRRTYDRLSDYAEPKYEEVAGATPLEVRGEKSVFLDDISPFHLSGKLYPDAYDRVVLAEAGSPPNALLAEGVESRIREESMLRDVNDVLTANIFKNLNGSKVNVVPLYEDPDAILNTPDMLAAKLADPVFHNVLGIDMKKASEKALHNAEGKEISAYEFMVAQGYNEANMKARGMDVAELKEASVYVGPPKMLANSDSAKRGTLAASTLNQISVVECYEKASRHLLKDDKGKKYLYVNQTYLGQGGALARTTGTDALVNIVTEQGEHPTFTVGAYSAMKSVLRGVTRLSNITAATEGRDVNEWLRDDKGAEEGKQSARQRVALETMGLGNPYGMRLIIDNLNDLKEVSRRAIRRRIATTRDDIKVPGSGTNGDANTRYEEMLKKYGEEFIPNYSARPASKTAKVDFTGIRAIGLAGQEFGFFSNIMGISEMMEFKPDGRFSNLNLMAKLYVADPSVKHNMDAGAYTACLSEVTMPQVWKKGGVSMRRDSSGGIMLKKGETEVRLSKLVEAYDRGETSFGKFDAADLAMANIQQQTENFVRGLAMVREAVRRGASADGQYAVPQCAGRVQSALELVPEHLRDTVEHARKLAKHMTEYFREAEGKEGVIALDKQGKRAIAKTPEGESLRMAKDSYYQLMETSLEQQALSRVKYVGAGVSA